VAYTFLILSLFFFGANHSGIHCAYLDVSPNFSSIMNTVGNTGGAVAGLTGPLIVSAFTITFKGVWGWRAVFLLVYGLCILALTFWALFQTSSIVPVLNTPKRRKQDTK
jgi:MFS family permease